MWLQYFDMLKNYFRFFFERGRTINKDYEYDLLDKLPAVIDWKSPKTQSKKNLIYHYIHLHQNSADQTYHEIYLYYEYVPIIEISLARKRFQTIYKFLGDPLGRGAYLICKKVI